MPNWVRNNVTLSGRFDFEEIKRRFFAEEAAEDGAEAGLAFDFNAVVPMPKDVRETESSSYGRVGLRLVLAAMDPKNGFSLRGVRKSPSEEVFLALARKALEEDSFDLGRWDDAKVEAEAAELKARSERPKLPWRKTPSKSAFHYAVDLGKRCFANAMRYGHPDWYSWANANWGTKWNACETSVAGGDAADSFSFQTAWAPPVPVLAALSRALPGARVTVEFADEDRGSNCGRAVFENGRVTDQFFPDWGSEEAEAFSDRVWNWDGE